MLRVLIVEDEDIIRKGLAYTIDWVSMDCVVVGEAANGEEGEEKILELSPDIVLADIMMPKQNGIEMIRRTKDKVPYKGILLTSYAEFEYARQAIDLKILDYLLKPVEVEKLQEAVERARSAIEKERESDVLRRSKEENAFDLGIYLERAKVENPHVHRMIELVKEHYDTKWGIEDAAADIGVSASFLSRKFKAVTEHTYLDFINKYRIQQAVKLLGSGKLRIYEISDKVGFTDYKHFNSVFKRYTGQSPTEFKNHTEREG